MLRLTKVSRPVAFESPGSATARDDSRPSQGSTGTLPATLPGVTRVLIADDDEQHRDLLRSLLESEGFDVLTAENGALALDLLQASRFDLLLTDLQMPKLNGLSLIAELRSTEVNRHLPVLLITGNTDQKVRVAALDLGADCISKPVHVDELLARIRSQLRLSRETWREGHLWLRDPLTGLFNRRGLLEALGREVARALRQEIPLSLLVLDLNGLNAVNDILGRPAGDRLIKACASAVASALRSHDVVARTGGDEFALVLPGAAAADTPGVIARLRRVTTATLEQTPEAWLSMVAATLSAGVPGSCEEIVQRLLETTDRARHADKPVTR